MSFAFTQSVYGVAIPVALLRATDLNAPVTFSGLTLTATRADDTLLAPSDMTAAFAGHAFPLSGADFLAGVTGSLTITFTGTYANGQFLREFVLLSTIWQGWGGVPCGCAGFGVGGAMARRVLPVVHVAIFVSPMASSSAPVAVPISAWH